MLAHIEDKDLRDQTACNKMGNLPDPIPRKGKGRGKSFWIYLWEGIGPEIPARGQVLLENESEDLHNLLEAVDGGEDKIVEHKNTPSC